MRRELMHSFVDANYPPMLRERIWQTIRRMRVELTAVAGDGKPTTAILSPERYCACYRSHGRLVNVLIAPGFMRAETRGQFGQHEHDRAARAWMAEAVRAGAAWTAAKDRAVAEYGLGDRLTHSLQSVSGVYRDHFPEDVKDELRTLARLRTFAMDASLAHWIGGAGKRIETWRREWERLQGR